MGMQRDLNWERIAPWGNVWEGALPMSTDGAESYIGCTRIHLGERAPEVCDHREVRQDMGRIVAGIDYGRIVPKIFSN